MQKQFVKLLIGYHLFGIYVGLSDKFCIFSSVNYKIPTLCNKRIKLNMYYSVR